jgi:hypothetical protein
MLYKDTTREIVFKTNTGWVVCFNLLPLPGLSKQICYYIFDITGSGRLTSGYGALHTCHLHPLL